MNTTFTANRTYIADIRKKSKILLLSTTAFVAGSFLLPCPASADPENSWDYDTVVAGNVGKDVTTPGLTNITVTGGNGYVAGNADIYDGHTVNVDGDTGATFAYRDNRHNIETSLNGDLNSNMRVVIIDKDGIFFENGSNVDVQSLVATTAHVGAIDVMNGGDLTFYGVKHGDEIVNRGTITVAEAGLAAFVSPHITNHGVINARMGNVVMAAGKTVTLDLYGDGLIEVAVNGQLKDALITNTNVIDAQGGNVQITAKAAKNTLDNIINNQGIIDASSATVEGGKIILSGGNKGTIKNAGTIKTSSGGSVEISGERFIQKEEVVPSVDANIVTDGGDVEITTKRSVQIIDGTIDARATSPENQGGNININNGGAFYSAAENTLKTNQDGMIEVNQNKSVFVPSTIQNVIDAIDNTGNGTNTINVSAHEYAESVSVDHNNIVLNGANAGTFASSWFRGPETIISPNSPGFHVTADNVVIDGFMVLGGDPGIFVDGADNASILNNIVTGSTTHGIQLLNADDAVIQGNKIYDIVGSGIHAVNADNILVGGFWFWQGNTVIDTFTGIRLHNVDNGKVIGNYVDTTTGTTKFADGIHIDGGVDILVAHNITKNTNDEGIYVKNSTGHLVVKNNKVRNAGLDTPDIGSGIELISTQGSAEIKDNDIDGTEHAGVLIKESKTGSGPFDVLGNKVKNTGAAGIDVKQNAGNISYNHVSYTHAQGINVENSADSVISHNHIKKTGDDAIDVDSSPDVEITHNIISEAGTNTIYGDGVELSNSANAQVMYNFISDVASDAVEAKTSADSDIEYNILIGANENGVYLDNSQNTDIENNFIKDMGHNGVKVINSSLTNVEANLIKNVEENGVHVDGGERVNVVDNTLFFIEGDAVNVTNHNNVDIKRNIIKYVGGNGIYNAYSDEANIEDNEIYKVGHNGIKVLHSTHSDVERNIISKTGGNGILGIELISADIKFNQITKTWKNGIALYGGAIYEVNSNDISWTHKDGIHMEDVDRADLKSNMISFAFGDGLQVHNVTDTYIENNEITGSKRHGVYVSGADNGTVVFQENTLTNNGWFTGLAAARFESGAIDMSDLTDPNTFINTTGFPATAMQFDNITQDSSKLTIVEETLGSTVFDGYTLEDSFYVRFEDGSILNPITGEPILINGRFASFDGVVPNLIGPTLPPLTLQFIEDRLYDADDVTVDGRGQIFLELPVAELIGPTNFQDFLQENIELDNNSSNTASLIIRGLPPIGNFGPAGGGASFNNITPAAGGLGGTTPEDLANINPEAGDDTPQQQVTCLSDNALNSLGNGSVTYNFGGSFEDSIAAAFECETASAL